MSSSQKRKSGKRKANIDSDEESAPEVVKLSDDDVVKPRKKSKAKKKKKFKNIVNLSSDEEDGDTNTISINEIKKKAPMKAKNAIKGDDPKSLRKTPKANNKAPHAVQKNNLFNYFQKAAPNSMISDEKKKEITQVNQKEEKREISDGFMTSTVSQEKKLKVDSKPAPKVKSSSTKESFKELIKSKTNLSKPSTSKVDSIETKTTNKSASKGTKSSKMKAPKPIKSVKKDAYNPVEIKKETVNAVESKLESPKESVKEAEPKRESFKKPLPPSLPAIDDQLDPKRVSDQWVDKYKPTSTKAIISQQGARSSMNKLLIWLRNWHQNTDKKPAYGNFGSDDGSGFRAVLLSGPPGIGKTTTAVLACKELNYDYMELNASDVRGKKSLHEEVRELLGNRKLTNYFKTATDSKSTTASGASLTAKHVVIMDEVDGMSGNADRGGVGELIQLIKKSKVPIICICNDRGHEKMRSLANYCFALRFPKPRLKAIRESLQAIALKENVKIGPDALNALIASSNFDIRQCIHNLSMLSAGHVSVNEKNNKKDNYVRAIKDVKLGPFEATKKVFSADEEYETMTFIDKSDLFFADYNIMSLFVYENYSGVNVATKEPSIGKQLIRATKAIDSISLGDIIEKEVRQNQNWGLLPALAAFSTVMPGYCMRSEKGIGMPAFPLYMGRLSTTKKNHRIVDELVSHMALHITGTRTSFPLDYFEPMRNAIVKSMQEPDTDEAVSTVLDLLESYSMTKDNMDSLLELGLWRNDEDPMKQVESQMKAALTRAYTKKNFPLPYATANDTKLVSKPKGKGAAAAATKGAKKGKKASLVVMDEKEESESDDNPTDEEEPADFYF